MQLVSVGAAKSIWLFDVNELNPSGKQIFPDALSWLGEKYSFQHFPKTIAEILEEKNGYKFKTGQFQTDNGPITVNFSIHEDGLVAETWASTEIGDQFLADILRSASARYGLAFKLESVLKKVYVSELTVQLESDLSKFGEDFTTFCKKLNHLMARHNISGYELTGMVFSPDTSGTSYKPPAFMVERKSNVPFSVNRYWSKSPFSTSDHLAVLESYEALLTGRE